MHVNSFMEFYFVSLFLPFFFLRVTAEYQYHNAIEHSWHTLGNRWMPPGPDPAPSPPLTYLQPLKSPRIASPLEQHCRSVLIDADCKLIFDSNDRI